MNSVRLRSWTTLKPKHSLPSGRRSWTPGAQFGFPLLVVRRQGGKASVLDWATHSEVVEALPIAQRDAEDLVNRIIDVAADPGRTNAHLFRLGV